MAVCMYIYIYIHVARGSCIGCCIFVYFSSHSIKVCTDWRAPWQGDRLGVRKKLWFVDLYTDLRSTMLKFSRISLFRSKGGLLLYIFCALVDPIPCSGTMNKVHLHVPPTSILCHSDLVPQRKHSFYSVGSFGHIACKYVLEKSLSCCLVAVLWFP
jgi:hypothetical protein